MLCFSATLVPVLAGTTGVGTFLFSMLVGMALLALPVPFVGLRKEITLPAGAVLVVFLAAYLFRLIPPVPLALPFIGVYHAVEPTPEGFRLSHERPAWRFWHNGDQRFLAQPGDRVHVYFRLFSPAGFSDHGWCAGTARACCRTPSRSG